MISDQLKTKFKRIHAKLNGSTVEYDISAYSEYYKSIVEYSKKYELKSNNELRIISDELKNSITSEDLPDAKLCIAYALVNEAIKRVLKLHPFDVQIIGGIVIHKGKLAEMQTGEGKTLVAVFPAYLNALTGKGVHILTFNDYLAKRDALWMGPVYKFLGLTVGYIEQGMSIADRQAAYKCDITYLTAKESGFDFLKDNLCYDKENIVHRKLNLAIIDEADSILIDEARVPLIIAGAVDQDTTSEIDMINIARNLLPEIDFEFDEYKRNIFITEPGQNKIEKILKCGNIYNENNFDLISRLNSALHAEYLLNKDVDYIVRTDKIVLIDEFTGRVADKRKWPDGLQAAIEAKENLNTASKGKILNSITLQHFIKLYPKICGMTATACDSEAEFRNFYKLHISVIPTNKPCLRIDNPDKIFRTKIEKNSAIINEIIRVHATGRPILVGTRSVAESALLADRLAEKGILCEVLNAKRDEYEAKIISEAGKPGVVTISTNMAGRGTDIKLGGENDADRQKVINLGGLYVLGTNRHESLRIDRQLRGRAGRQGDPGSSRFIISMEDDLFIRYRLKDLIPSNAYSDESVSLDNPILNVEVNRVQRIIEGQNYEIKKTVCKYSNLIENQRIIIQKIRQDLLHSDNTNFFISNAAAKFNSLKQSVGMEEVNHACQIIPLFCLDKVWSDYLAEIADLREGIHLLRLGGQDPLFEFHKQTIKIFEEVENNIYEDILATFNKLMTSNGKIDFDGAGVKKPSSTWTYLINDNPFEDMLGVQLMSDIGLSIAAGVMGPLMILYPWLKKTGKRKSRV
jgi:preprotein translocase subunit SecA